ncbi:hypothetical protein PHYSODRAFT_299718 [Phytophthora sojae]|uniref:CCHC-type domain-containing protein n=1 Tax=Phytophthora sojae (strain P6497) TaxID=1094619 RepID=G4Z6E9_PHYSP|nr:hypothetical protein PHYSODRAFT_299718 [Phytophthora sojae]EGZ22397.1 hypothetical protein PHYSODRAFT_299718 [Phytophthora sojae]|eukprot:XP_009525114.1 hypothetical protein PHYSODRAFT_299718 [Phytophthora sojae]
MEASSSRERNTTSSHDDVTMEGADTPAGGLSSSRAKRPRAQTDQGMTEDELDEEELIQAFSEEEWADVERHLQDTTTEVVFAMNERLVKVNGYRMTLADFKQDIIELCKQLGVLFEGDDLIESVMFLSGRPKNLDRALWLVLKKGEITVEGVRIWVQSMFTGKKTTPLTLNELEYMNCNRVSVSQLCDIVKEWGGADFVVVSHGYNTDRYNIRQRGRRPVQECLHVAATESPYPIYSFRLFFPSPQAANRVRQELFRVGIFGLRVEIKAADIEEVLESNGLGKVRVEIRGKQPLFGVGTCMSSDQQNAILTQFGPEGANVLKYKNTPLYLRKWEDVPAQRRCHECKQPGHLRYACPRLTGLESQHQPASAVVLSSRRENSAMWTSQGLNEYAEAMLDRLVRARTDRFEQRLLHLDQQQQRTEQYVQEIRRDLSGQIS